MRQQRAVLNGQTLSWLNVTASVPQDSVLGPLLFDEIISSCKIFAEYTSLF